MQNPVQSLLLKNLYFTPDARILILEGGYGWLAAEVTQRVPQGEVLNLDRDFRNIQATENLLAEIPNAHTSNEVLPSSDHWDIALLTIPKERRFARALLAAAWEALKPGGQLLLGGPTRKGAKAVITDAERLFGNSTVLGYRDHQRVASCIRGDALPDPLPKEFQQPGIAPGTQYFIEVIRPEGTLTLETHPGIFSWEALDEGTALLLDHLRVRPGERVWDVGCGCGMIGLSAAIAGAGFVAMSDVNLIAVDYTKRNYIRNQLTTKVEIFPADVLSPVPQPLIPFDLIVSNPAFHQGREVDKSMADELIIAAPKILAPSGRLMIVANRFLNYDRLMRDHFRKVNRIAETNKFHVIEATN
jgi:16S rRNA (guanine1207-N2)-methyltransferase